MSGVGGIRKVNPLKVELRPSMGRSKEVDEVSQPYDEDSINEEEVELLECVGNNLNLVKPDQDLDVDSVDTDDLCRSMLRSASE